MFEGQPLGLIRQRLSLTHQAGVVRDTGISVYAAPSVKPGKLFPYFDPIDKLAPEYQERWADKEQQKIMLDNAIQAAREGMGDSQRQQ